PCRTVLVPLATLFLAIPALCSNPNNPVTLDKSETLFSVLAAINTCGYDTELPSSEPVRLAIRSEIGRNLENSEAAKAASEALCAFYRDHQPPDGVRTLSEYLSLALYLTEPPAFAPKVKDAELPPDAGSVLGLVPLLGRFYAEAGLKDLWARHAEAYSELEG